MNAPQSPAISGHVADGFAPVRDAFAANFDDGKELGAGFSVYKDGEFLVDLVGGHQDRRKQKLWASDTLVPIYSCSKAITAIVIAWLVDKDRLSYTDLVVDHWPEFGAHGKDKLTIGQMMSHQSGLSGLTGKIENDDWYNPQTICAALAAQEPIWPPGTASGYHPITYGFLAGEIARRTDAQGRTLGTILQNEICGPEGIDFYIGTPVSVHGRIADLRKPSSLADLGAINPATKAAFMEPWSSPGGVGTEKWRLAEFPAANGHTSANALARLMQLALTGKIGKRRYISDRTLTALKAEQYSGNNLVLPFHLTFAAGVMINRPNHFYGPNGTTVGHSGWGGSCTFADETAGLTCAYVMNKQSNVLIGDERPARLIEAFYGCL